MTPLRNEPPGKTPTVLRWAGPGVETVPLLKAFWAHSSRLHKTERARVGGGVSTQKSNGILVGRGEQDEPGDRRGTFA